MIDKFTLAGGADKVRGFLCRLEAIFPMSNYSKYIGTGPALPARMFAGRFNNGILFAAQEWICFEFLRKGGRHGWLFFPMQGGSDLQALEYIPIIGFKALGELQDLRRYIHARSRAGTLQAVV